MGRIISLLAILVLSSLCWQNADAREKPCEFNITVGSQPAQDCKKYELGNLAGYYLPYAMHAWQAYSGFDESGQPAWPHTLKPHDLKWLLPFRREGPAVEAHLVKAHEMVSKNWIFLWGHSGPLHCVGQTDCAQGIPISPWIVPVISDLEVQAWRKKGSCDLVISFRGTDPLVIEDWIANLRWVTWIIPIFSDEYDQVRKNIRAIVATATNHKMVSDCKNPNLIAVGHSLGGGLAQHAAYSHGGIKRVYAFDPTPVTGAMNIDDKQWAESKVRLEIDRVHQSGEILQPLRRVTQDLLFTPTSCDPLVRKVALNVFEGNILGLHSIEDLMVSLMNFRVGAGPLASGLPGTTECTRQRQEAMAHGKKRFARMPAHRKTVEVKRTNTVGAVDLNRRIQSAGNEAIR